MFTDRRALRGINTAFTVLVLVGIVGIAVVVYRAKKATQSSPIPPKLKVFRELRQQAVQAEKRGALAEAEGFYRAALERSPGSNNATLALVQFYDRTGQKEKAWKIYSSFVPQDLDQKRPPLGGIASLLSYGDLCLSKGQPAKAEKAYEAILRTSTGFNFNPNSPPKTLKQKRSEAYVRRAFSGATERFGDPSKPESLTPDQLADQEKYLRQAVAIDPPGFTPRQALALFLVKSRRPEEGMKLLQSVENDIPPEDYSALWSLSQTYLSANRPDDTKRVALKACRSFDLRETHKLIFFGDLLKQLGAQAERDALWQRAVKVADFRNTQTVVSFGNSLLREGKNSDAKTLVAAGMKNFDSQPIVDGLNLAQIAYKVGLVNQAKVLVAKIAPRVKTDQDRVYFLDAEETVNGKPHHPHPVAGGLGGFRPIPAP